MDALLQIVIPQIPKIEGLDITQPVYEWDGIAYPQGPKIVSWQEILLSFDEQTQYLEKYLPPNYLRESWIWLKVSDESLDKYDVSVKTEIENSYERPLESFLSVLLAGMNSWIIAFILHYDQIDNAYNLGVEDCVLRLRDNLKANATSEGFVAYK